MAGAKRASKKPISPRGATTTGKRLAKLRQLSATLPEAVSTPVGRGHVAFTVRRKTFAYYLNNHHGDGLICLCAKAPRGRQEELVAADPQRFLVPAYLGPSGWVSLRLDGRTVDWGEVLVLLVDAYRLQAPRALAAMMQ